MINRLFTLWIEYCKFVLYEIYAFCTTGTKPLKRQLKHNAIPSVFSWSKPLTEECEGRDCRAKKRLERFEEAAFCVPDIGTEVVVEMQDNVMESTDAIAAESSSRSITTQTPKDAEPPMSVEKFAHNDGAIHKFTGLETYLKFLFVLGTLGPAAYQLQYRWRNCQLVSVPNQFFLTLIKFRKHWSDSDLAEMFDISEFSVGNIIVTWINFLYRQWSEIDIWGTRDLVSFFMPSDFKAKFPTTRIILDGTECPIKKPKCPLAQQCSFSTYKNRNTAKVVVGISPGGLVTHIPPAYGGATSDRQFVERSGLMQLCTPGDSIMVDKGMKVQDLFAPYDITINIPTFLKKGNQFNAKTLSHDRKVASKRVHVERLIGLAKTYAILTQPMNATESQLSTEIIFICFMFCNFRMGIVPHDA